MNVLLVTSDRHEAATIGAWGDPLGAMPALDRLAAAGTRFAQWRTQNPFCQPARATILTARYPSTQAGGVADRTLVVFTADLVPEPVGTIDLVPTHPRRLRTTRPPVGRRAVAVRRRARVSPHPGRHPARIHGVPDAHDAPPPAHPEPARRGGRRALGSRERPGRADDRRDDPGVRRTRDELLGLRDGVMRQDRGWTLPLLCQAG